jgi:hypothetical protein
MTILTDRLAFRTQWIFWLLQLIFAIWAVYWLVVKTPNPGYSIGLAAAVAAAMSIHPDMKAPEKAIWMVLIGLLVVAEFHAIKADKNSSDDAAKKDRTTRDLEFQSEMDSQNRAFIATTKRLLDEEEQSRNYQVALTKGIDDNLNALTGGDSYCFVGLFSWNSDLPSTAHAPARAMLSKIGKWPLYGVRAKIILYRLSTDPTQKAYVGNVVQLPDLASGDVNPPNPISGRPTFGTAVESFAMPDGMDLSGGRVDMILDYQGRNVPWRQVLHIVVVNNLSLSDTTVARNGRILFHHTDKRFPDDGYPWRASMVSADH